MKLFPIVLTLSVLIQKGVCQPSDFFPAKSWLDTRGESINAHGAGILLHQGIYYLYGEIKKGKTWLVPGQNWECYRVPAYGISCYSSKDLVNWKYEGVAMRTTTGDTNSDIDTSRVVERPKVLYNKKTNKFVMWMHIDKKDYAYARAGVAVSDKPTGPFKFLHSEKPNGNDSRDMTLFLDEDGKAYHIYSSENNDTMRACELSEDFLSHTRHEARLLVNQRREAPALFKHGNKYYLITSGCTGWSPNPPLLCVSDHPLGPWKEAGNPCVGNGSETTFVSQSTFVIPAPGKKDSFIFLADRWNKSDLPDSRYVWLPLTFKNGKAEIVWQDHWRLGSL
jgi:beta-xylosidase